MEVKDVVKRTATETPLAPAGTSSRTRLHDPPHLVVQMCHGTYPYIGASDEGQRKGRKAVPAAIGQLKPVNVVVVRHRARYGKGKDVSDMREVDKPVHRLKSHRAALGAPQMTMELSRFVRSSWP